MSNELLEKLILQNDTLIRLQAANAVKHLESQKDKIEFLSSCGMRPSEIAMVLGTTANSVSVSLARIRKGKK